MGSVEISWERSPCVGPPYIRIVISWHDIIISWHDIIISWHDTIISCCVWFEASTCGGGCKYVRLRWAKLALKSSTPILDKRKGMNDST